MIPTSPQRLVRQNKQTREKEIVAKSHFTTPYQSLNYTLSVTQLHPLVTQLHPIVNSTTPYFSETLAAQRIQRPLKYINSILNHKKELKNLCLVKTYKINHLHF